MTQPKIVHLDIEVTPNVGFFWQTGFGKTILPDSIIKERYMLGFSFLWEGDGDNVKHVFIQDTKEFLKDHQNDNGVIKALHAILDEADLVVTHNGNKFDLPWFNTRALMAGLKPPSHYRMYDTLKEAKRTFYFNSNKLDYITKTLGLSQKSPMSFQDWVKCWYGDVMALEKMAKYCDADVIALRDWYHKVRGWSKQHPNLTMIDDTEHKVCVACGSSHVHKRGTYVTSTGKYQRYQCVDCGYSMRDTTNLAKPTKRASNLRNLT